MPLCDPLEDQRHVFEPAVSADVYLQQLAVTSPEQGFLDHDYPGPQHANVRRQSVAYSSDRSVCHPEPPALCVQDGYRYAEHSGRCAGSLAAD